MVYITFPKVASMANSGYSPEAAKAIVDKLKEKGWNLYKQDAGVSPELTIEKGPATELELDIHYVALPAAKNPKNSHQVFGALDTLAKKLNKEMPTIKVVGESHPWTGMTLHQRDVKLHTQEGIYVSYNSLVKALDTIVDTTQ
jgi:hypothetical protein